MGGCTSGGRQPTDVVVDHVPSDLTTRSTIISRPRTLVMIDPMETSQPIPTTFQQQQQYLQPLPPSHSSVSFQHPQPHPSPLLTAASSAREEAIEGSSMSASPQPSPRQPMMVPSNSKIDSKHQFDLPPLHPSPPSRSPRPSPTQGFAMPALAHDSVNTRQRKRISLTDRTHDRPHEDPKQQQYHQYQQYQQQQAQHQQQQQGQQGQQQGGGQQQQGGGQQQQVFGATDQQVFSGTEQAYDPNCIYPLMASMLSGRWGDCIYEEGKANMSKALWYDVILNWYHDSYDVHRGRVQGEAKSRQGLLASVRLTGTYDLVSGVVAIQAYDDNHHEHSSRLIASYHFILSIKSPSDLCLRGHIVDAHSNSPPILLRHVLAPSGTKASRHLLRVTL